MRKLCDLKRYFESRYAGTKGQCSKEIRKFVDSARKEESKFCDKLEIHSFTNSRSSLRDINAGAYMN